MTKQVVQFHWGVVIHYVRGREVRKIGMVHSQKTLMPACVCENTLTFSLYAPNQKQIQDLGQSVQPKIISSLHNIFSSIV